MVARVGENFYRMWAGQIVTEKLLWEQMAEGLAQRHAYIASIQCDHLKWYFRTKVLGELLVSGIFI